MTNENAPTPKITIIKVPGTGTATIQIHEPLPLELVYEIIGAIQRHDAEPTSPRPDQAASQGRERVAEYLARQPMPVGEYAERLLATLYARGWPTVR